MEGLSDDSRVIEGGGLTCSKHPCGQSRRKNMSKTALFIKHKALPGKRDAVRRVWEKHLQGRIAENAAHEAYFFCYDEQDPDLICVFQLYGDTDGPKDFVAAPWYPAYEEE